MCLHGGQHQLGMLSAVEVRGRIVVQNIAAVLALARGAFVVAAVDTRGTPVVVLPAML